MQDIAYLDPRSGQTWSLSEPRWCGPEGQPLLLTDLPGIERGQIQASERSLWRYAAALPFQPVERISLGEGCTPLVKAEWSGAPVRFKCEWFMPSGSFKDRGASVMLSLLRDQGIKAVLEDSSGNGGAAIATYAAAGGMRAKIMVPASTSPAKTVQSRSLGAEIELVPGSRQDCADAALAQSNRIFYASHNWHPFFLQGTKTLAYELWEDLGFRAPDNVIVPCGAGSNVLGCGIGFAELLRAGQIRRMPRIFAAQPENCGPIARDWLGEDEADPMPTVAEGTAIAQPLRMAEVLEVLRASAGGAVLLSESEIIRATRGLAGRGFYVEPTCAQAAAAFGRLLEDGQIRRDETTVVVLTGSGLKATQRHAELAGVAL
ncbi:pyridoxal-5'-phosphate-dependent protein subunit beta [Pseudoroseomonas deserti]|uniref:Pyridoxal-5'-phosphate-dependent protein subunit beta n=1 Tax=Teichococcus deserti TaxID=1817963 RepID=A0A1V2H2Q2_9PROT|nr:pyridoxal-phosphate dependent enzyme [Pseudoroseomonas deserti]ONG52122.1 pyridoxal-5'-phosphate-dependent protein subunit beta [Pseudoroseomonas deserti]